MLNIFSWDRLWENTRETFFLKMLLIPLSVIYVTILIIRQKLYDYHVLPSFASPIPSICVGNISVGGSGKTPLVLYISEHISSIGRTGILSRGYKSNLDSTHYPYLVKNSDPVSRIGDEAKLFSTFLSDKCLMVISPDRKKGLDLLSSKGASLCIMDDGFQHRKIKPTISLCVIDVADFYEYERASFFSILPNGIFREIPVHGIKRADRIVFTSKQVISEKEINYVKILSEKFKISSYSFLEIRPDTVFDALTLEKRIFPKETSIFALSSIAKPDSFVTSLHSLGFKVSSSCFKNDHHLFTEREWEQISLNTKVPIICTTKDWVKLKDFITKENSLSVLSQKVYDKSREGEELIPWLQEKLGMNQTHS
jgi:tetraacyldisaccharide 4'-kinase